MEKARGHARLGTSRRDFLAGAAATGAGALLPAELSAAGGRRRRRRKVDVAVVGAGLAGLTAAQRLSRARVEVCLLEARDRVGGRVLNHRVEPGVIAELGGQYVGPTQDRLLALADSLGVDTFPTYNEGDNVLLLNGRRSRYPADPGLSPDPEFQEAILTAIAKFDPMAAEVPVDAPWKAPRAEEWDAITLEAWKQQNLTTPGSKKLFDIACESVWGAEPRQMSLLYALAYIAGAGNETTPGSFVRLVTTPGGAQESRFVGGSQRIAQLLARRLGERVVLRSPVRSIEQGRGRVIVTSDRVVVEADQVVVALPPAVARRIDFTPALPRAKRKLLESLVPGRLIKWEAVYDEPFWREQGLSGQAVSELGPANATFDNTPPSGSPGILFGFVGGCRGAALCEAVAQGPPRGDPGQLRRALWRRRGRPPRLLRPELDARGMDARVPRRPRRERRSLALRAGAAQANGPYPLGRHRDVRLLERLHGWRRALREESHDGRAQRPLNRDQASAMAAD